MKGERDSLVEAMPFAVFECGYDDKGRFIFMKCGASVEHLLFVAPEELARDGDAAWRHVDPDHAEQARAAFDESALERSSFELLLKVRPPAGGDAWVRARITPESREDRGVAWSGFFEGAKRDTLKNEEAKRRNALLRNIFENQPDHIYSKDAQGRIVDVNAVCCQHHGLSKEEMLGKTDRELYPGARGQKAWEKEQRLMAEGQVLREREYFEKEGVPLYLDSVKIPLFSVSGRLLGLGGISRDVTDQVLGELEMERAKCESERYAAFIQAIFDNLDDHFYYKDAQSKVIGGNKKWIFSRGADSLDDLVGKTDLDLYPGPLGKKLFDGEQELIASGKKSRLRERHELEDGSVKYMESIKCPMKNERGEVIGLAGISRDVTEQVENETALIEARRAAEVANEAKSMFLAMMSHEIRTPMNGVIGAASLLAGTELTPIQNEFVRTISVSAENLLSLINDILDYSKIEAGKIVLDEAPFSLRSCVEDSFDLFARPASKKNLELFHYIDPAIAEFLVGDSARLRQVLVNLIGNAVKFTERGEVGLRVVSLESDAGECRMRFSVRDTGIGIPEKAKKNLFQAFTQVEGSSTRKYEGTGLGLTISRRMIELMGGQIWFESKEGEGTTFFFELSLPVSDVSLETTMLPRNPVGLAGTRALVVDDNETNRWLLGDQLTRWSVEFEAFAEPEDALRHAKEGNAYDIALLDFNMPELNGRELAEELRKFADEKHLPIIILSSSYEEFGSDPAIDAWLSKPVKQEQLYACMIQALATDPIPRKQNGEPGVTCVQARKAYDLRVLVAEDNVVSRRVVKLMLERLGYAKTFIVPDGADAVAAVIDADYDLVFMDVQMRGMDGLEAARLIREHVKNDEVPRIIALTAGVLDEEREAVFAAGMNGFLAKPLNIEMLEKTLNEAREKLADQ